MKLSIVIPTHKPDLKLFIQTLIALSNQQTDLDYEVIVVENPELNPETKKIVTNLGFTYINSELGSNNARNAGILHAGGDLIAITDDDCLPPLTWVSDIFSSHYMFPNAGIIAGPLKLEFECDKPKWIVNDFRPLLSEVDFVDPSGAKNVPFDINNIYGRYAVSANLTFTRKRYDEAGRLDGNIGLHGKEKYISNDEIQFVNRCTHFGIPRLLWVPKLSMKHLVPEYKCTIEFMENKSYGQGYSDGVMWIEENPKLSKEDLYHNFLQHNILSYYVTSGTIMSARNQICDETQTRVFIRNLIRTKTAYVNGAINALEERELWKRNV